MDIFQFLTDLIGSNLTVLVADDTTLTVKINFISKHKKGFFLSWTLDIWLYTTPYVSYTEHYPTRQYARHKIRTTRIETKRITRYTNLWITH